MIDEILKSLLLVLPIVVLAVGLANLLWRYNPEGDRCEHGTRHDLCESCREEGEG
jgi:hypothetical protein